LNDPSAQIAKSRAGPTATPESLTVVGLSGGVDSALSLALLQREGVAVQPVFMKNWEEDDRDGYCSSAEDLADARRVCDVLGLELRTVNLSHEYWEQVFEGFLVEIRAGRTPNPDVVCNQELKFKAFAEYAGDLGAGTLATGHYARLAHRDGRVTLLRAADEDKDQTYFLHRLDQRQLALACFPVGALHKPQVRAMAAAAGLDVSTKRDSTGICFVGERPFAEFLSRYVDDRPGPIESIEGQPLGEHRGLSFYTIGQRQGLGIGGRAGGSGGAWYVAAKRMHDHTLVVAQGHDHPALYAHGLRAGGAHWIAGEAPLMPLSCAARIRHRQPLQPCRVRCAEGGSLEVRFDAPQWAVAPGQYVVFYRGEECLGGATIECAL
jgi:tRNA-specific 2-thiouridylase